jgi:hypothetical protein
VDLRLRVVVKPLAPLVKSEDADKLLGSGLGPFKQKRNDQPLYKFLLMRSDY